MLAILLGLGAAMLIGLFAHGVYGTTGIMAHEWIDIVFLALVVSGAAVALINAVSACLPCQLSRTLRMHAMSTWLCRNRPCKP